MAEVAHAAARGTNRRGFESERLQMGVVVFVLTMAVSWIFAYATVVSAPLRLNALSPGEIRKLSRQHAAEMVHIEAQTAEVYGSSQRPAPAGS